MELAQIQFRQTSIRLDIRSTSGRFDIRTEQATMDFRTQPARLDIESEPAVVMADMSKTWDALTGGHHLSFMNRIYDQYGQYVIRSIENTVREYNQIGDLTQDIDPIPEIAHQRFYNKPPQLQVYGKATPLNISFDVRISEPQVQYTPGSVQTNMTPNKPEIEYQRGEVRIEVAQYPSVTFMPPQIDYKG